MRSRFLETLHGAASRLYRQAPYRARVWGYVVAMLVVAGFIALHALMVLELGKRSSRTAVREAQLYAYALTEKLLRRQDTDFLDDVMRGSEVPLLYVRLDGTPSHWRNIPWKRGMRVSEGLPWSQLPQDQKAVLTHFRDRGDQLGLVRPIVIGGTPLGILYYGEYNLEWQLPALLILGAVAIVLLAILTWVGLKIMQGTERSLLWVGLARETAHQLGTPISSLMGWIEYMKLKVSESESSIARIPGEMERDLGRLQQVVARFSQIGSLPELHQSNPNFVVQTTCDYFAPRLPHQGPRKVELKTDLGDLPEVRMNTELMGWVLENLIKNALDSIDRPDGLIRIRTTLQGRKNRRVRIDVEDNGRGIPSQHLKDVFLPGWSTKKRGWGLGLALARRIVEQYHGGRIWVERSRLGEGTVFSILIPDRHPTKT